MNAADFVVGDLLVEPDINRISRDHRAINLRPQVMNLLIYLASHHGQVVGFGELLDKLWPGKVVTDGTLYNCVGELRHAISSLDDTQPYIENIPKKGYRLTVAVTHPQRSGLSSGVDDMPLPRSIAATQSDRGLRRLLAQSLVAGLIIAIAAIYYLSRPDDIRSIAVLPFEDISPSGDQAYLAHGIADELRLALQELDGLNVAGRTSSNTFAQDDTRTIAELLNVDAIIEGSIRTDSDKIRITAQLTQANNGITIWSEAYSGNMSSIFELQEQIARSVAGALGVRLGVGTINAYRGAGTRNIEAYELYLKTQTYNWTRLATDKKIRMLERAVELDPNYAAAWSFLGGLILSTAWDVMPQEVPDLVDRAYPMVLRGVRLDPESATAHFMLGVARYTRYDWIGAEESHRRSIELMMDRLIVEGHAWMLMRSGRTADAQEQYDVAYRLEPLGGRPPVLSWHTKVALGQIAEARAISDWQTSINRVENNLDIALNENDPHTLKAAMQAYATLPEATAVYNALLGQVLAEFDSPERVRSILRQVYRDADQQWTRKLHDIGMLAAYFGDPQFALKVKGEDVRTNVMRMAALWYPVMSEVRQLPEFKTLVTDLNLVDYWRAYRWADYCRPVGEDDFECT